MPRIRTIKPEFPQSESMGRVSRDARLLFILLWTLADDTGKTRGASRMLASLLFPFDTDAAGQIEKWLAELEREGCIRRYVVDDTTYLQVEKWSKHQKVDKPSPSRLPDPPAKPRENSRSLATDLGPRTLDLVSDIGRVERVREADSLQFDNEFNLTFWPRYPVKNGRKEALAAFRKARATTDLATIMAGLTRYLAALSTPSAPKPKYAQGWLNGERWTDENVPQTNGVHNGRANGSKYTTDNSTIRDPLATAAMARALAKPRPGAGDAGTDRAEPDGSAGGPAPGRS